MRNTAFIIFGLILLIVTAGDAAGAGVFPLKVEQVAPGVTRVSNAADVGYVTLDANFTPDGQYLIVSASGEFTVIPVGGLDAGIENLDRAQSWKGDPAAYLPSGKIVFSTVEGLYALDPATKKTSAIYRLPAAEIDPETTYLALRLTVLSDDLIISGDGDSPDGRPDGNILRFDLKRGSRTRGAAIPGFYNPRLAPGGRYILYEHGNGLDKSYAELYDVARDRRYTLASRFNLKRAFPKYEKIVERPVAWTGANTFLAEVEKIDGERELSDATYRGEHSWLVLFDAATGRIVWKTQPAMAFGATRYQSLSASKMLVDTGEGMLYELSLTDGKVKRLPNPEGWDFVLSPDKKKLAYYQADRIFVSALDGSGGRKVLDVPKNWELDRWRLKSSLWSPDGTRLIVFGSKEFMYVRL